MNFRPFSTYDMPEKGFRASRCHTYFRSNCEGRVKAFVPLSNLVEEVMPMDKFQFLLDMVLRLAELVIQFLSYRESKKGRR